MGGSCEKWEESGKTWKGWCLTRTKQVHNHKDAD